MSSPKYAVTLRCRQALRADGLCIDCRLDNPTPEHWRCRACRAIESTKQVERAKRKRIEAHPVA